MFTIIAPEQVTGLAWWPPVAVVVLLVLINIVNNRVAPQTHYLLWSFGGSVLLLAVGLLDGNSWTDMGLGWRYLLPGLIWAAASIGLITAVYVIGSFFRRTRAAFHDERMADMSAGRLMFQALIEVPFGTVLFEEIAFRGVLFAMLARRYGLVWALVGSALLFGLWHILPSIGTHEQNPALGSSWGRVTRGTSSRFSSASSRPLLPAFCSVGCACSRGASWRRWASIGQRMGSVTRSAGCLSGLGIVAQGDGTRVGGRGRPRMLEIDTTRRTWINDIGGIHCLR